MRPAVGLLLLVFLPDPNQANAQPADTWIVSETTSPVDYSPVVVAAASSGTGLRLSIECRAGRTDLAIHAAALSQRADDYSASYSTNGGAPVAVPVAAASPGPGLAVKADVVRLLAMLPDQGDLIVRVAGSQIPPLEGRFALPALKSVLERLVIPCRWVPPVSRRSP